MENVNKKDFIINFIFAAVIFFIAYFTLRYALPTLAPFIVAFTIAFLLKKPARYLSKKLKIPKNWMSIFLVLVFYSTIGIFLSLAGFKIFTSIRDMISNLPKFYAVYVESFLKSIFSGLQHNVATIDPTLMVSLDEFFNQFTQSLGQMVSNLSIGAVGMVSDYATSLPGFFIKIVLMIITTFFFAVDYEKLTGFVMRQFSAKSSKLVIRIKEYLVGTLFVCIRSYALIMGITFVELSIGFSIIGIDNPILVAFFISLFDILPVLGTGGIMIPWVIITALQGDYQTALALLAVYAIVTIIRNILEPKIVGSQIGLHPALTLMSMFVGVKVFGILGLFGLPITLSLLRYLNDSGEIKFYKSDVITSADTSKK